jgi:dGTPase
MGTVREELERLEEATLHPRASRSAQSRGRKKEEEPCGLRTSYQRDRDRILHSKSFRRLKHKTQVFLAPRGDHYRTRLTHTLEVAQIARTIAKALRLNEELTEAIALGHDLGHTPFGHAGEEALDDIVQGGFSHVEQSLRVVEVLEKSGKGLNLTFEVLDGIRKHSKGLGEIVPEGEDRAATVEGQVVRLADIVAYINHDIDDAIRAGVLTESDLPGEIVRRAGTTHAHRIGYMVRDVIESSFEAGVEQAVMSESLVSICRSLRDFLYRKVYFNPQTHREFLKASKILRDLFEHYMEAPEEIGDDYRAAAGEAEKERIVCDFIAGMTDRFATMTFKRIFLPEPWKIL